MDTDKDIYMYKRTMKAILENLPETKGTRMFKAQFSTVHYEEDVAFCLPTVIDSSGTYGLIENEDDCCWKPEPTGEVRVGAESLWDSGSWTYDTDLSGRGNSTEDNRI